MREGLPHPLHFSARPYDLAAPSFRAFCERMGTTNVDSAFFCALAKTLLICLFRWYLCTISCLPPFRQVREMVGQPLGRYFQVQPESLSAIRNRRDALGREIALGARLEGSESNDRAPGRN